MANRFNSPCGCCGCTCDAVTLNLTRTTINHAFAESDNGWASVGQWTRNQEGFVAALTPANTSTLSRSFSVGPTGGTISIAIKRSTGNLSGTVRVLRNAVVLSSTLISNVPTTGLMIEPTIQSGSWTVTIEVIANAGNPAGSTVSISDFSLTNSGDDLRDWEILSGTLTAQTTFDADFVLRSRKEVLCKGMEQPFFAELRWGNTTVTPYPMTVRMDARLNPETDTSWFTSCQAFSATDDRATGMPTVYGIRDGGDNVLNAVDESCFSNGGFIQLQGMQANNQGNVRQVLSFDGTFGSRSVASTGYVVGDMFCYNGPEDQPILLALLENFQEVPMTRFDIVKLRALPASNPDNWMRYRFNQLKASKAITDVVALSQFHVGDCLMGSDNNVTITFADGSIELLAGQSLRCESTTYNSVSSWSLSYDRPFNDYFISATGDPFATFSRLLTARDSVRGSSTFFSENRYGGQWEIISGGYIQVAFSNVFPRTILGLGVTCGNGLTIDRLNCYLPRPAIHFRPKQNRVTPVRNLYQVSSASPPGTLFAAGGTEPPIACDLLGSSEWRATLLGVAFEEFTRFHIYRQVVFRPATNDYLHVFVRMSELARANPSQNRPRQLVGNLSVSVTVQSSRYTRSTSDDWAMLPDWIANVPIRFEDGVFRNLVAIENVGSGFGSLPVVPAFNNHFYSYPDTTVPVTRVNPGTQSAPSVVVTQNMAEIGARSVLFTTTGWK